MLVYSLNMTCHSGWLGSTPANGFCPGNAACACACWNVIKPGLLGCWTAPAYGLLELPGTGSKPPQLPHIGRTAGACGPRALAGVVGALGAVAAAEVGMAALGSYSV